MLCIYSSENENIYTIDDKNIISNNDMRRRYDIDSTSIFKLKPKIKNLKPNDYITANNV